MGCIVDTDKKAQNVNKMALRSTFFRSQNIQQRVALAELI